MGFDDPRIGHRYGSEHVATLLGWCRELDIRQVTVFVAHFCDSYWPGFRRIDLLRALRAYAERRAGT